MVNLIAIGILINISIFNKIKFDKRNIQSLYFLNLTTLINLYLKNF